MISFFNQVPEYVESHANKIATKKDKFSFKDFCQSNFFFKNGAIAKITSNFGCVHNHQHVIKIYGSKKTFIYDDNGARIFNKYDPSSSKKIKIKNLYSGKDCLLPEFFKSKGYILVILGKFIKQNGTLFAIDTLNMPESLPK